MNYLLKTKLKEILKENLFNDFNVSLSLFNISKNIENQFSLKSEIIQNISGLIENKYLILLQGNFSILSLVERLTRFQN